MRTIRNELGDPLVDIEAYAGKHLFVHRPTHSMEPKSKWKISHEPTGWGIASVGYFKTAKDAVAMMNRMERAFDWSRIKSANVYGKAWREARVIVERLRKKNGAA